MGIQELNSVDIAISGLQAQQTRLKVLSSNVANANTTRTANGEPYRRQDVVLGTDGDLQGVTIEQVIGDMSTDFKKVHMPGHPDADEDGMVAMPNVDLPVEMMNMVTASRAYQANAAVLKRYQDSVDTTLELLR